MPDFKDRGDFSQDDSQWWNPSQSDFSDPHNPFNKDDRNVFGEDPNDTFAFLKRKKKAPKQDNTPTQNNTPQNTGSVQPKGKTEPNAEPFLGLSLEQLLLRSGSSQSGKDSDADPLANGPVSLEGQTPRRIRRKAPNDSWGEKQAELARQKRIADQQKADAQRIEAEQAESQRLAEVAAARKAAAIARQPRTANAATVTQRDASKTHSRAVIAQLEEKALRDKQLKQAQPVHPQSPQAPVQRPPRQTTDLSALEAKAYRQKAAKKQAKRAAALRPYPGIQAISKPSPLPAKAVAFGAEVMRPALSIATVASAPVFSKGAGALGAQVMNPALSADAVAGTRTFRPSTATPPQTKDTKTTQPVPLFPVKPDLKLASTALRPQMFPQSTAPQAPGLTQTPLPQKLAQSVQRQISTNQTLSGDALTVEALSQTFNCPPEVAQQLLKARRQAGQIDSLAVMNRLDVMPNFLSTQPLHQYNVNMSQSEYDWYSKYVNMLPMLRDADLKAQQKSRQSLAKFAQGATEQQTALKTSHTLSNRGNYGRLMRQLNHDQRGQDAVPTSLDTKRALLSPVQAAMYDRKLQNLQKIYGDQPLSEFLRQSVLDQVQFETRLDVMEIHGLGRSLDPKRRQKLEALYDSKNETFKDKAEQSVSTGFREQWGFDPVFGKETAGKVKRVMRDRYLIQSDRRAMEIAYLGRPLSAPQRKAVEAFYAKLTPAQQQEYSQKSQAEFELMWGNEPPNAKVAGQMKWVLRAQQMEKDFAGQVVRGAEQAKQPAKQKAKAQPPQNTELAATDKPNGIFDARFAKRSYDTLFNQGKQEQNPFKLATGTVGGAISTGYVGLTEAAQRGVEASAGLVVAGQQEGGPGGFGKQVAGYTLGMFGSLAVEENLPSVGLNVSTAGISSGVGALAQAGKLGAASVPVLRTMQIGGAFTSGTSIGQGLSGKDMWTGRQLSPLERGVNLTLGAAGSLVDLGTAGLTPKNAGQSFPTLTNALEGVSAPQVTRTGGQLGVSTEGGAIRVGRNPDEVPKGVGKDGPEAGKQKGTEAQQSGKQPKNFPPKWKASMTSAEAEAYTQGSHYEGKIFYHGTNRNGANSIASDGVSPAKFDELSTYGPGFYVGKDKNIARNYAKRKQEETGQEGAVLSVMLNVRKPKIFSSGIEYTRAVNNFIKKVGNVNEEWNVAFNNHLRKEGYDAIELSETGYTVVFNREQVVTTSNEVTK
jgi:hypothetical protein